MKLANQQDGDGEEDEDEEESADARKAAKNVGPALSAVSQAQPAAPRISPSKNPNPPPKTSGKAQQQVLFLEGRKKQFMAAALRSKQNKDLEGAKLYLRQAKGLDSMMEAARGGLPVDITKIPPAPVHEEAFSLGEQRRGGGTAETDSKYQKLMEVLKQQHEMCMSYSQQFTHLGNITETAKHEKLAEECMKHIHLVKQAHTRGLPVPRCHYEERTINIVK
ncbi:coiled-coil and C2 domain-containing protein 1A-like [Ascaphus truei]|uniref:coiled-coil and C2 domain-containing protein 1A-like n=1 Tax=Ascaphus truei TaxID=8439 RepID=UPI003F599359